MSDIDGASLVAYRNGRDPIDWAADLAEIEMDVLLSVRRARAADPAAFPGYVGDLTLESCARKIVGSLLEAGWTPPERKDVAA